MIFLFSNKGFMQIIDYSEQWKNSLLNNKYFTTVNINEFLNYDLSSAISNDDNNSLYYLLRTYTGVFGSNYRRIDFFIKVIKDNNNGLIYHAEGKNKFNSNIRPIKGVLKLLEVE